MLEVVSYTIIVKGYPPIMSQAVWRDGELILAVTSGDFQIQSTYAEAGAPVKPMVYSKTVWCARCRRLVPGTQATDGRLGFRGYCNACVQDLASRCQKKFGRLPVSGGEFFCAPCVQIKPIAALCPPERDGRRRLRCRECRVSQLRAARLRRKKELGL